MLIEVKVFGQIAPQAPHHQVLEVPDPSNVGDVVTLLGLDEDLIGLITINGRQSEAQDMVFNDCHLCFFPYMSGG
jgi:hypothetical protein